MSLPDLHTRLNQLAESFPPAREDPTQAVARRVRRHRRRVWGATAVAVVVALVAATGLWAANRPARSRHVTAGPEPATGSATAAQLAHFHWSELPPAPIQPRSDASVVWTGRELVVWGGVVVGPAATPPKNDDAAFDPASNRWRTIAAPTAVSPRWQALTLWSGQEMFVIGGQTASGGAPPNDGAYDPITNQWRTLPPRPPDLRGALSGAWDGHEALVVSTFGHAAAYDPAGNAWRPLPALPEPAEHEVDIERSVWAGDQLLVWAEWAHDVTTGNVTVSDSGIDLWAFHPDATQPAWNKLWSRTPGVAGPDGVDRAIWTGQEVVLPASGGWAGHSAGGGPGFDTRGYRYNPSTNTYRLMGHGPVDDFSRDAAWTGGALVRTMHGANPMLIPQGTPTTQPAPGPEPGSAAAWDPTSDTWTTLASTPPSDENRELIWTGREILSYGQQASFRFGP